MSRLISLLLALLLSTGAMLSDPASESREAGFLFPPYETLLSAPGLQARCLMREMTLEEQIGQLFLIRPESLSEDLTPAMVHHGTFFGLTQWDPALTGRMTQRPPGGVILFGKNIIDPDQLTLLLDQLSAAAPYPLFLAIDEEGGRVARIGNNPHFSVPRYESMETITRPEDAFLAGTAIGSYLKDYGFQINFAPVADVNTNPDNVIIGDRAFGDDPQQVALLVREMVRGYEAAGILPCLKHFPGHGDTHDDTHHGAVVLEKSWEELLDCELIPFLASLEDTPLIMVSHITLPNVTTDGLPASLSYQLITEKLRHELGYQGLIVTDSLAMGAVTDHYDSGQAALMAFQAGADLLLMPEDYALAFDSLLQAAEEGVISRERLEKSVLRVLTWKARAGLIGTNPS